MTGGELFERIQQKGDSPFTERGRCDKVQIYWWFHATGRISHSISVLKTTNCCKLKVLIVYNLLRCFPLAFSEAAAIVRQVTIAIAHLHSLNIAHRDLKVQCTIICTDLKFKIKHIVNNTLWTPLVFTSFIIFFFFFTAWELVVFRSNSQCSAQADRFWFCQGNNNWLGS